MKKALIIGPGYPVLYSIISTANNISDWQNTLTARGFSITILRGSGVTKALMISRIKSFISSLAVGDSGVLVFTGHGASMADSSGDEIDKKDECIAPSDFQTVGVITDDELGLMIAALKVGAKLDVVLDCCYAGTGTRNFPRNEKSVLDIVEFAPRFPILDPLKSSSNAVGHTKTLNHRLWSACKDNQLSYDVKLSTGLWKSIFTAYACWAIRQYPSAKASELITIIRNYVTSAIPTQEPQLEGINLGVTPF